MKSVALHNLGCKVNSYEMEVMQQLLQEKGYNIVSFDDEADIYIINTCSVTNIADRKSRQMLHRAKARNPRAVVVAVGCYVQTARESGRLDQCIDLAVGNNRKNDLPRILEEYLREREENGGEAPETRGIALAGREEGGEAPETRGIARAVREEGGEAPEVRKDPGGSRQEGSGEGPEELRENPGTQREGWEEAITKLPRPASKAPSGKVDVIDINHTYEYEEMNLKHTADHTRAYIKIQDGCNQFCSYCIIPYARGRVRSRRAEDILREIRGLTTAGYQEVVLTGIHISSYGLDLDDKAWEKGESAALPDHTYTGSPKLIDLIERIHGVKGLARIRLGSLEPRIVTPENAARLAGLEKLCPHFHLSLQSGCDETLKRMNRHYNTREYFQCVEHLRGVFDNPAITTDVIVGFPGETDGEFETTEAYLRKIGFYEMHVFKYSRRQGTRAADMPEQVPERVKAERSRRLILLERGQSEYFRRRYIGKEALVLFEEQKQINGKDYQLGYTPDYVKVALESPQKLSNCLKKVKINGFLTEEILNSTSLH